MSQSIALVDALDAAEQLDPDAQAELVAVLNRRLAERGRERIAATVEQARREFATGQSKPMTLPRTAGLHPAALQPAPDFDAPLPDEFWSGSS